MEYKACTPQYFLDEMKSYELSIILNNLNCCVKNDWEMSRQIMWSNLTPYSKKKIKPSDVLTLPWDNKGHNKKRKEVKVTEELVKEMTRNAEANKQALIAAGII